MSKSKCVITVYGIKVDVVRIYKERGFSVIPPTLTLSGQNLRGLGKVPPDYALVRSSGLTPIGDYESVIVNDGDEFLAIPPATY